MALLGQPLMTKIPKISVTMPLSTTSQDMVRPTRLVSPITMVIIPSAINRMPKLRVSKRAALRILNRIKKPAMV